MKITDFISITKLHPEKDWGLLESGRGLMYKKQGAMLACIHNGEPMRYLAFIEFAPNTPRGGHYHNEKIENICVVSGKLKAKYWLADNSAESMEIELSPGDTVNIKPGMVHVYESTSGAFAVEFSPNKFELKDVLEA